MKPRAEFETQAICGTPAPSSNINSKAKGEAFMRNVLAVMVVMLSATIAGAQEFQPYYQARGLNPYGANESSGIDNVNLFSGGLSIAIPLGQRYTVGPTLWYGFTLVYSAHVWDFRRRWCADAANAPNLPPDGFWANYAVPSKTSNAGLGWTLTLGILYPVDSSNQQLNAYVSPDTAEHAFFSTLHDDDGTADSGYWYTRDGSYLRLHRVSDTSATVEFPDGTVHRFQPSAAANCTATTCPWRLVQMTDRFNNSVTIAYAYDTAGRDSSWTITDSVGRSHTVNFGLSPSGTARISSVVLAAFGGSATYTLSYPAADTAIARSTFQFNCTTWETTADVSFLTSIQLPDLSAYSMADSTGNPWYFTDTSGGGDSSGVISRVQVPTGGQIAWTYADWPLPTGCLYNSATSWMPALDTSLGVATRQLCDSAGANCATWTYTRAAVRPGDEAMTTTVTLPPAIAGGAGSDGETNTSVHYFRTDSCTSGSTDYSAWDFGLPFTQAETDGAGHYLSSREYKGSVATSNLVRSTFVSFEHDRLPVLDPPPQGEYYDASRWWATNRRLAYQRTVYKEGAGEKYASLEFSSFDGLGHYRKALTGGDFDAGNTRTEFTGFNPDPSTGAYRTYHISATNTQDGSWGNWKWPWGASWVLGTFDATTQTENSVTARQEYCFEKDVTGNPWTGYLRATRTLKGAARDNTDLLTVYTRDSAGQTVSEQYLGGDKQATDLPAYCSGATSRVTGAQYRIDHSYSFGMRATSKFVDPATGQSVGFNVLDLDINQNTGLPSASRDSAGIQTALIYDSMGRLTQASPSSGNGACTVNVYHRWSEDPQDPMARVEQYARPNDCSDTSYGKRTIRFDHLGRPAIERSLRDNGQWNERDTAYNAMGWVTARSEWYPSGGTATWTTFTGFDPFGRPATITPPDGSSHSVTLSYLGVRQLSRTVWVATSTTEETRATTTEVYDRQGRLYQLREPSGADGTVVTTTYSYDVGNRLTTASTTSDSTTQVRVFTYDKRGLLTSEDLPEKLAPSGQSHDVTYRTYDARGLPGQIIDGGSNLAFAYDPAGRPTLVAVADSNGDPNPAKKLKEFTYDKLDSVTRGASLGKVVKAVRHNWIGSFTPVDYQVAETYTYGGVGGRVSQRTTDVEGRTITQNFAWSELGLPATIGYPDDTGLTADPARTVPHTYTNGYLTAVSGFATLAYAVNMTPATITFANGVATTYQLDPNYLPRVASISTTGANPNANTGTYTYDGAGNIKAIGPLKYAYDHVSRLVSGEVFENVDPNPPSKQTATYDAFGNITSTAYNDQSSQTFSFDAATNRLTSPVSYDLAGRMTAWSGKIYTWDDLGQLQKVAATGVNHTYLYTASGERISDRDALAVTRTLTVRGLDGKVLRVFVENGSSGSGATAWVKDYVWGNGMLLASVSANPDEGTRYYAVDHLGTPRVVTDGCAVTTAIRTFYPFGLEATSGTDTDRIRFTGQERDLQGTYSAQTDDLDNLHARFFNPNIARFLSADPLRGDPYRPQTFNLFAYVSGNPTNLVDPFGLQEYPLQYWARENEKTDSSGKPPDASPSPADFDPYGHYGYDGYAWQHNNWWTNSGGGGHAAGGGGGTGSGPGGTPATVGPRSALWYLSPGDCFSWRATQTGLLAWADGFWPFGDPLATRGYYDAAFPGAMASQYVGTATLVAGLGVVSGGLTFEGATGAQGANWVTTNAFRWGPPQGPWGWHLHLGLGYETLMKWHLPGQFNQWRHHASALIGRTGHDAWNALSVWLGQRGLPW